MCIQFFAWLGRNISEHDLWTSSSTVESHVSAVTEFIWVRLHCWSCLHWLGLLILLLILLFYFYFYFPLRVCTYVYDFNNNNNRQWKTNMKSYQMAAITAVILNHNVAGLFECNPSNICAAFYTIWNDNVLALFLSVSWASCLICSNIELLLRWFQTVNA